MGLKFSQAKNKALQSIRLDKNHAFEKILLQRFAYSKHVPIFAHLLKEQQKHTLKRFLTHINPSLWSVRLGVRTPDFHSGNTGSIPVRTTFIL